MSWFLAADIPLFKINNPKVGQLFIKLGQPVPSESSCRVHMIKLAKKEVQLLKECLNGKRIFLIGDESEINGTKYLNILIGETAVPEKSLYNELQCCRARQPASSVREKIRSFNEAGC